MGGREGAFLPQAQAASYGVSSTRIEGRSAPIANRARRSASWRL